MHAPNLRILIDDRANTIVTVAGEVDLVTSIELKRTFDALFLVGTRAKAIGVGARLVVTSASPALQRQFDVTGLAQSLMP